MIRALPTVSPRWRREADVVVVGSGAAGIAAALTAAGQRRRVLLITKELAGGATPLAQGGLAAAIGPGDSAASHVADTLIAGAGLCERDTVAALATGAPEAICWLAAWGARLEQKALRLEGGHSSRRIVHSGDDATGAEVHRALREALLASPVEILDQAVALDLLLTEDGAATGLLAATIGAGGDLVPGVVTAGSVVLAAGGLGQAFATTSNPPGATGDALAIAARAGAELRDLEFVQFHPTVLWLPGATGQCPLITEALRGAGAVLRDLDGRPLMAGRHPRGDLAPRDVVAARMHEVIAGESRGGGHLWLDATALGREVLEQGFPTVTAACRRHGIDPVTEPIPVAPGAHYSCGGIRADMDGCTSIPGLYAVGEAASTGVQGANRLASNSVTEAVIAGRRTGEAIGRELPCGCAPADAAADRGSGPGGGAWPTPAAGGGAGRTPEFPVGTNQPGAGGGVSAEARGRLAAAMSRYAGVMRDQGGLERLVRTLEGTEGARRETADTVRDTDLDLATVEATNLHAVSAMIAAGALRRAESRGCHRRLDTPETAREAWHTLVRWDGRRLRVTRRAVGAYAAGWDQVTGGAA